jgi:hypothetical protein
MKYKEGDKVYIKTIDDETGKPIGEGYVTAEYGTGVEIKFLSLTGYVVFFKHSNDPREDIVPYEEYAAKQSVKEWLDGE